MNIYDLVEFSLTDHGKTILENTALLAPRDKIPHAFEDGRDLYRLQLWQVMQVFGPHIFSGAKKVIIDNEIRRVSLLELL